jgi:hypothetical protein
MDSYPPKLRNKNKKVVHSIACSTTSNSSNQLVFSRWGKMSLPDILSASENPIELDEIEGYFAYEPFQVSTQLEWYLNFAHSDLFCAYGDSVFAQDEMQVAEHPALGSLREALLDQNIKPFTVESNQPTPILIRGAERKCIIATDPNPEQDRPHGLYGNNFARAKPEAIQQATQPLNPPSITNIIAMEAPPGGYGSYTITEIEYILVTAFTGFLAAGIESKLALGQEARVSIHTGFWGCGAYGGNRILMALLQLLAARLSKINCLVFHTGNPAGSQSLATAQQIIDQFLDSNDSPVKVSALIEKIYQMEFLWGISDGN